MAKFFGANERGGFDAAVSHRDAALCGLYAALCGLYAALPHLYAAIPETEPQKSRKPESAERDRANLTISHTPSEVYRNLLTNTTMQM
jgi:hypothetical protein